MNKVNIDNVIKEVESSFDRVLELYKQSQIDTAPLHYDFVSNYPSLSALKEFDGRTHFIETKNNEIGIYIHFPFCDYKCDYCYFVSTISYNSSLIKNYIDALKSEIMFYAEKFSNVTLSYIYFGGGTPTAVDKELLEEVVNLIYKSFKISENIEFTCEGSPNTLTDDVISFLANLGISRISIGVQSFDESVLLQMKRVQSVKQVENVIESLHKYYPSNFNVDFIFGHYSSNRKNLFIDLEKIKQLELPSVTFYQIWLNNQTQAKKLSDSITFEDLLYQRMCISTYMKNLNYSNDKSDWYIKNNAAKFRFQDYKWGNNDFVAIGVSSYGYINGNLYRNILSIKDYITQVDEERNGIGSHYHLNEIEIEKRRICLGLKMNKGIIYDKNSIDFNGFIDMLIDNKLMTVSNNQINLSYEGFLMSDMILKNI
ncbi:hypothetical protein FACS189434_09540 [Bacteroidia bacterium]|nr:hypothetical protein FACS189434_09540 [Bacteroidia bacterium]